MHYVLCLNEPESYSIKPSRSPHQNVVRAWLRRSWPGLAAGPYVRPAKDTGADAWVWFGADHDDDERRDDRDHGSCCRCHIYPSSTSGHLAGTSTRRKWKRRDRQTWRWSGVDVDRTSPGSVHRLILFLPVFAAVAVCSCSADSQGKARRGGPAGGLGLRIASVARPIQSTHARATTRVFLWPQVAAVIIS